MKTKYLLHKSIIPLQAGLGLVMPVSVGTGVGAFDTEAIPGYKFLIFRI
jgi:hypothetical protein